MTKKLLIITFLLINGVLFSQETSKYNEGYCPISFQDAFEYMEYTWTEKEKEEFKKLSENQISYYRPKGNTSLKIGFIFGYCGLIKSLYEQGIGSKEDIPPIVLKAFHRKLNNVKVDIDEIIKPYKEYWEKIGKETEEEYNEQFKKFKIGDTLTFKYLRTFVNDEQEKLYYEGNCRAKGILLEKTQSDFSLKIKLIEICDDKGIITVDFRNKTREELEFETKHVGDIFWNFYNDWEPNTE